MNPKIEKTISSGILATVLASMDKKGVSDEIIEKVLSDVIRFICVVNTGSLDPEIIEKASSDYLDDLRNFLREAKTFAASVEKINNTFFDWSE